MFIDYCNHILICTMPLLISFVQNMLRHSGRQQARRSMGICLQENVIYETLTVFDHLQIVARLRGTSSQNRDAEVFSLTSFVYLPYISISA